MKYDGFDVYCAGKKIFGQCWSVSAPKVVILLVHGLGEHAGRYSDSVVPELIHAGCSVLAFDHFGHGHSEGVRGTNPGYEFVLDCVDEMIKESEKRFPGVPVCTYGHSMGGNVVLVHAMRRTSNVKAVIATSPFLRMAFKPPVWKLFLGKLLWKLAPGITMSSGLNPSFLSRIPSEVEKYKEDPLTHFRVSGSYVFPFLIWGEWILNHAELLKISVLLVHGTGDQITSHWASKSLAKNSTMVTLQLFENGYHELHHDEVQKDFFKQVISWLNHQFPGS